METTVNRADKESQLEDVVIVGGGIAGMAVALALHRVGVKSVVLEKSPTLRTSGTSLVIWTNGWRALEELGVAGYVRERSQQLSGIQFCTHTGRLLSSILIENEKRHVEFGVAERKVLLEALVEPLPVGTVRLDSQVENIHKIDGGYTQVELQNGATIQTKVLLGCDGNGSVVGRYLGLEHPGYTGYIGIRGMGVFSEEHGLSNELKSIVGQGVRTGYYPLDSKRAYWFVLTNQPKGKRVTDPKTIKEEALSAVEGWPQVMIDLIRHSPLETLNFASVSSRCMWPFTASKFFSGGVAVAGDAMHSVRPIFGQGGNCALEDGVILGRLLSQALKGKSAATNKSFKGEDKLSEMKRIELALSSFASDRQARMFPIAISAYGLDALIHMERGFISMRDALLSTLLSPETFLRSTFYDCGALT